jgi:hypothetical protein
MIRIMILMADTPIIFIFNGNYKQAAMKKFIEIPCFVFFSILINCNSGTKKLNINQAVKSINKTEVKEVQFVAIKDSLVSQTRPTYQELYRKSEQINEAIGKLKYDPSTRKKEIISKLNDNGDEGRIELYHLNDRIITIEERNYDKSNKQINGSSYDFDEKNACFSNCQWITKDKMSYYYAMYWDTLIKFDVYCKLIDLTPSQKQEIIKSTKASLDSIMRHFPEFKYSYNWK